ncbi:MAG: hypothetical protein JRH20_05180 [Deltaproteobacteria bacterium]|nr:hypothetical protein [Deltaproteobacteria bacterium]
MRRVGGTIVSPTETLAPYASGGAREGGFNDLLALLLLQALSLQFSALTRAFWQMVDTNILVGAMSLLQVLAQMMLVPLTAVLVGGVLLRLLHARVQRLRHLDLAALCAIPAVALQVGVSLLAALAPALYQHEVQRAVWVVAGVWFLGLLVLAHRLVRQGADEER